MTRDDPHPTAEREDLLTAALRVLLAERNWADDAVPQDDLSEYDARDAFLFAARAYVRAVDVLPTADRPRGWDLNDAEDLRAKLEFATKELTFWHAHGNRQQRVVDVFVRHHQRNPLPEDVRKQVVAAMDGYGVPEFPGRPGSRWCDVAGDVWVLGDDGRLNVVGCTLDPNDVAETYGPMTPAGGAQ